MVDWQFTVFCREVGFVEIYAFLVLIFFGQKCISAIFITFCISVQCHSLLLGHYETADLPPAPLSEGDLLISIQYLLSQIDR